MQSGLQLWMIHSLHLALRSKLRLCDTFAHSRCRRNTTSDGLDEVVGVISTTPLKKEGYNEHHFNKGS